MKKNGISIITQGFITGVPGGILAECLMYKIQGSVLLAKADKAKPDPVASALLLESVNKLYGISSKTKRELAMTLATCLKNIQSTARNTLACTCE